MGSRTRLVFAQQVLSNEGASMVEGTVTVACMNLDGKPCAIPEPIRTLIQRSSVEIH